MAKHNYYVIKNWFADVEHDLIANCACGSIEASEIMANHDADLTAMYYAGATAAHAADQFRPTRVI